MHFRSCPRDIQWFSNKTKQILRQKKTSDDTRSLKKNTEQIFFINFQKQISNSVLFFNNYVFSQFIFLMNQSNFEKTEQKKQFFRNAKNKIEKRKSKMKHKWPFFVFQIDLDISQTNHKDINNERKFASSIENTQK